MNIVSQSIHASLCQNSPYLGPKLDFNRIFKKRIRFISVQNINTAGSAKRSVGERKSKPQEVVRWSNWLGQFSSGSDLHLGLPKYLRTNSWSNIYVFMNQLIGLFYIIHSFAKFTIQFVIRNFSITLVSPRFSRHLARGEVCGIVPPCILLSRTERYLNWSNFHVFDSLFSWWVVLLSAPKSHV